MAVRLHLLEPVNAAHVPAGFSLRKYSAAIVAASLHLRSFEPEIVRFVSRHATRETNSAGNRAEAQAPVERTETRFLSTTGWYPSRIEPVTGALRYTKYNFITRWIMQRIARKTGLPTETFRDGEFTDWPGLDRVIDQWVRGLEPVTAAQPA